MEFILVKTFANYMEAHIVYGRLEDVGINCWLKDENTVSLNPLWNITVGGIKLMVAENQVAEAKALLQQFDEERRSRFVCPQCGSGSIELVSSNRNAGNWIHTILGFLFGYYPPVEKIWHCFKCKAEFKEPREVAPTEPIQ
jgi:ribosomal protein L37AE/L43A